MIYMLANDGWTEAVMSLILAGGLFWLSAIHPKGTKDEDK